MPFGTPNCTPSLHNTPRLRRDKKLRLVLFRAYSWSHNHIISLGEYYRYIQIPCWSLLWLFCRYLRCTADRGQTLECTELDVSRSFKLDCPWHLMANNMRIRIHVKVVKVQILSIILSLLNPWKHGMINMVLPRKGCAAYAATDMIPHLKNSSFEMFEMPQSASQLALEWSTSVWTAKEMCKPIVPINSLAILWKIQLRPGSWTGKVDV